jgi:membrane protein implicated in regulation of membrane protease activity
MFAVLAGLGILTMALFPIALPGLLLFVVAPLALVAVVGLLLAIPLALPLWVARLLVRSLSRRRRPSRKGSDARDVAAENQRLVVVEQDAVAAE